jgi:hypothetical protein
MISARLGFLALRFITTYRLMRNLLSILGLESQSSTLFALCEKKKYIPGKKKKQLN